MKRRVFLTTMFATFGLCHALSEPVFAASLATVSSESTSLAELFLPDYALRSEKALEYPECTTYQDCYDHFDFPPDGFYYQCQNGHCLGTEQPSCMEQGDAQRILCPTGLLLKPEVCRAVGCAVEANCVKTNGGSPEAQQAAYLACLIRTGGPITFDFCLELANALQVNEEILSIIAAQEILCRSLPANFRDCEHIQERKRDVLQRIENLKLLREFLKC